ncbi:MAG TPA: class I adenylate-forming enzyme family protein [Thermoanaerobaculia bacterium]|nr:class I adenylate-forming enzyme family protein [Thermoanaerobaculia bacterium]
MTYEKRALFFLSIVQMQNQTGPGHDSILEVFARLADLDPDRPALIDGATGRITTRRELQERALRLVTRLRAEGLVAGDFTAVQLPNSVDFVAMFLAGLTLRLTMIPIDRDARESENASVLNHFSVRALVYRGDDEAHISVRDVDPIVFDGGHVPLIKLSSGSTGRPRGIVTTEANLIADCRNICSTMAIGPDDTNLGAIPFSHSYGFSNLVTPLLLQGTAVVISNDYLPLSTLDLANRFGCSIIPGIPMMYEHLAQLPRGDGGFTSARTFISAGAPLTPTASIRFRERFGASIQTFYGCSESGGIAFDRAGAAVERGSVGHPLEGVQVTTDPRECRLIVRSGAVAAGYLNAPPGELERFRDGMFVTDDLAQFNGSGELELLGRLGELINTAGKKVNPREVEAIIHQLRGVRQVRVYGEPAGARGEVVAAAVVADPDITREQIREHCRLHLSSHKVPRIVKLIERIPVDERGKVKRSALAAL